MEARRMLRQKRDSDIEQPLAVNVKSYHSVKTQLLTQ